MVDTIMRNTSPAINEQFPSLRTIDLAREGDATAISQIFQKFHQGIFQYLVYRTGDTAIAEDLTSDVFIRMVRGLPGYHHDHFKGWLYSIARNVAIDQSRKEKNHPSESLKETIRSENDSVEKVVEGKLTSDILKQALGRLNPDHRDVIIFRIIAGLSLDETARVMKKSVNAIKGLQRRALTNLKQVLVLWNIDYD